VGSVRLSCRLPSGAIFVVMMHRVLFDLSLPKSLYRWNSIKLIGTFALIDDGVLQVVRKLDRSVVINTLRTGNDFVLFVYRVNLHHLLMIQIMTFHMLARIIPLMQM
jgi:hypothetical protein